MPTANEGPINPDSLFAAPRSKYLQINPIKSGEYEKIMQFAARCLSKESKQQHAFPVEDDALAVILRYKNRRILLRATLEGEFAPTPELLDYEKELLSGEEEEV